jgi:tetratricopeptide (TPR) repeat protein
MNRETRVSKSSTNKKTVGRDTAQVVSVDKASVFISHTHSDKDLAVALKTLLNKVFLSRVESRFSTSKELGSGIDAGQDWFQWIVDQVRECEVAFVLLTPASVQKPWILWESGAVYGASEALGDAKPNKVRPLLYQVKDGEVPSPLQQQRGQAIDGTSEDDVVKMLKELLAKDFKALFSSVESVQSAGDIAQHVRTYLADVQAALRDAPLTVTEAAVQEWLQRLAELQEKGRVSEVAVLHDWIRISFGRERDEQERPLDLRIHRRLGEIYQDAKDAKAAIAQYRLAEKMAPRDLYLLRKLGQALLDDGQSKETGETIERIRKLDKGAFEKNQECAALNARYLTAARQYRKAADALEAAIVNNKNSYYLWELQAQALLQAGDRERAKGAYKTASDILGSLKEQNIWTHATAASAAIAFDDDAKALTELHAIRDLKPTANNLESVERGQKILQEGFGRPKEDLTKWKLAMSP